MQSISSRYWQLLGAHPSLANAIYLDASVNVIPIVNAKRQKSIYLESSRIRFTVRCTARVVDEVYTWEVLRHYQHIELLWATLLAQGLDVPQLPTTFDNAQQLVVMMNDWLRNVFHAWQCESNASVVALAAWDGYREIAKGFQRFCLQPESLTPNFGSLLQDVYLIVLRVLVARCERMYFGTVTSGLFDSSVTLGVKQPLCRKRMASCPLLRFCQFKVLRHQYRKQTVFNIKNPASSLRGPRSLSGNHEPKEDMVWKNRRESESSTFSCGVQRFRFTKQKSMDDILDLSEEAASALTEDPYQRLSDSQDEGCEEEGWFEQDRCKQVPFVGKDLLSWDGYLEVSRTQKSSKEGVRPNRIDVVQGSFHPEIEDFMCWTPVSIPTTLEEKEEFDKQSLQYTLKTLEAAAQVLQHMR